MRALWENAEVKKASVYKIWMFVHYERELELFQEWPYFSVKKCIVQWQPVNVDSFTCGVLMGEYHVRTNKSLIVMNFTKAGRGILL